MKKKSIYKVSIMVLIIASIVTLTACSEQIIYDAGAYGQIREGSTKDVIPNAGYHFIDWSEPVKKGRKTIYKAQYEYAEYYLEEIKDVYEIPHRSFDLPYIKKKVTNMQTMEVEEDKIASAWNVDAVTCTDDRFEWGRSNWLIVPSSVQEFDGICTIYISDSYYNIEQKFELHVIRNRIKAESIEIFTFDYKIGIDVYQYIHCQTEPNNTSFKACGYNILEIIRDGKPIDEDKIADIAYCDDLYIHTTDKAQYGDIIKLQAYNLRDPDVLSNVFVLTVY